MSDINLNIKNVVYKNLVNKRNEILSESFVIDENIGYDEMIRKHAIIAVKLINEGYTINEIANYIDKANSSIQDLTNTDFDYGEVFKDSMKSMAKEFAIKFILEYFGFNPTLSTYLAQGLSDLSFKDIILPFKDRQNCINHLPNVLDSILEVIVRQAGHKLTGAITGRNKEDAMQKKWANANKNNMVKYKEDLKKYKRGEIETEPMEPKKFVPSFSKNSYDWSNVPEIGLGNIVGEIIRKTPTSEAIANVICKSIHK